MHTLTWHQYGINYMTPDLRSQLIQEVQQNNLTKKSKILFDFSWHKDGDRWLTISIYDKDPYHSYFVLKYAAYIISCRSGETTVLDDASFDTIQARCQ